MASYICDQIYEKGSSTHIKFYKLHYANDGVP